MPETLDWFDGFEYTKIKQTPFGVCCLTHCEFARGDVFAKSLFELVV
jgi:hypothetical protein